MFLVCSIVNLVQYPLVWATNTFFHSNPFYLNALLLLMVLPLVVAVECLRRHINKTKAQMAPPPYPKDISSPEGATATEGGYFSNPTSPVAMGGSSLNSPLQDGLKSPVNRTIANEPVSDSPYTVRDGTVRHASAINVPTSPQPSTSVASRGSMSW